MTGIYLRRDQPVFNLLHRYFMFMGRGPQPRYLGNNGRPDTLTDEQLREDAFHVARQLVEKQGQALIRSTFGRGIVGDPGFRHPIPTEVKHQVLNFVTEASEAAGVMIGAYGSWASASGLSQLRYLYETFAYVSWLLDGDEDMRRSRALTLVADAIDLLRKNDPYWQKLIRQDPSARIFAARYKEIAARAQQDLDVFARDKGIAYAKRKPAREEVMNTYGLDLGAYPAFAAISNAGSHPNALQPLLVYGELHTGVTDFDFAGKNMQRAYWIMQCCACIHALYEISAPVLGWQRWPEISERWVQLAEPLRTEAVRRFNKVLEPDLAGQEQPQARLG